MESHTAAAELLKALANPLRLQIVMALRSMYYPATGGDYEYGFWHGDHGSGERASDMISWVKLGSSLVGRNASFVGGPHRVKITMEPDEDHEDGPRHGQRAHESCHQDLRRDGRPCP